MVFALWVVGLSIFIILERRAPAATIGWIFALLLLPYVGIPVYFLVGPRKWDGKKRHLARTRALIGKELGAAVQAANARVSSSIPEDDARLVALGSGLGAAAAACAREIEIFQGGAEFYAALEEAIAGARHHIHLEFYIWSPDRIGTRLRDLLMKKVQEGVELRLLVDAVGSPKFDKDFMRPLQELGAEVLLFNKPKWFRLRSQLVNFRTHRKIVVIDGELSFIGGMNISERSSKEFVDDRAQRDTHLKIVGMPSNWLQLVFLENWHFSNGGGPSHEGYLALDTEPGTEPVQIVASGPDTEHAPIHKVYLEAIHGAKQRIWIVSPYFVPDVSLVSALQSAALRGVDVRVLVPAKNDQRLVRAASRTYYDELIDCGVRIFEYLPRMHHAKTLIADDDLCIIGTANLDNRSFRLNFEVIAVLYGLRHAAEMAAAFESDLLESREAAWGEEDDRPLPLRFGAAVARLLSPLL